MDIVFVNLVGVASIGWIVWFFWLSESRGVAAAITDGGVQETYVVVKGGYSPDTIEVRAGQPVRLVFNRQEADPCSERVVFDAFGVSADLPPDEDVAVEFTPGTPGEYEFACQMGMLRGRIVAK